MLVWLYVLVGLCALCTSPMCTAEAAAHTHTINTPPQKPSPCWQVVAELEKTQTQFPQPPQLQSPFSLSSLYSPLMLSNFRPVCNEDGSYAPIQCWYAMRVCWCATPEGLLAPKTNVVPLAFGPLLSCPNTAPPAGTRKRHPSENVAPAQNAPSLFASSHTTKLVEQVLAQDVPAGATFMWGGNTVVFLANNKEEESSTSGESLSRKQLFGVELRGGNTVSQQPVQLTREVDTIVGFIARPRNPTQILLMLDHKGTEHPQLVLFDITTRTRTPLFTDSATYISFGAFSPCGSIFSYTATPDIAKKQKPADVETNAAPKPLVSTTTVHIYHVDLQRPSHALWTYVNPVGVSAGVISADLSKLLLDVGTDVAQDSNLELLELPSFEALGWSGDGNQQSVQQPVQQQKPVVITEHASGSVASWSASAAKFHPRLNLLYTLSNEGEDFSFLQAIDLSTLTRRKLLPSIPTADVNSMSITPNADHVAIAWSHDGFAEVKLFSIAEDGLRFTEMSSPLSTARPFGGQELVTPFASAQISSVPLPKDALLDTTVKLSSDGSRLLYSRETLSSERRVMVVPIEEGRAFGEFAVTNEVPQVPMLSSERLGEISRVTYPSFDGINIPAFLIRPAHAHSPAPFVILVHGGPKSFGVPKVSASSRTMGSALAYLNTKGLGVLVLNIRGSVGYGKRFSLMDIGEKRPDAVQDVLAAADYLCSMKDLVDCNRVGVVGGSYGGWMTLQAITQPGNKFSVGLDVFGMSSLETFFKNTAPKRRRNRMLEYGASPETLRKLSPLHNACQINSQSHLLVLQGENDIRVPASESTQMGEAVRKCGGHVDVVVLKGEGHGFVEKTSIHTSISAIVEFLSQHMKL